MGAPRSEPSCVVNEDAVAVLLDISAWLEVVTVRGIDGGRRGDFGVGARRVRQGRAMKETGGREGRD